MEPDAIQEIHRQLAIAQSEEVQKKTTLFNQSATQRISCTLGAVLSIETAGIPSSLLSEIKHFASLHNPIFYERQKFRLSTFRTPWFIKCYDRDNNHIHFPRGLTEKITATINAAGGEVEIDDLRPKHEKIKITFQGTLSLFRRKRLRRCWLMIKESL